MSLQSLVASKLSFADSDSSAVDAGTGLAVLAIIILTLASPAGPHAGIIGNLALFLLSGSFICAATGLCLHFLPARKKAAAEEE